MPVATVIDVGASNGCWSQRLLPYYPKANYLLIEAQRQAHGAALEVFAQQHPRVQYVLAAAGNRRGVIYFDASDPFGGLAGERPFDRNNIEVAVTTVDDEVRQRSLPGPYLLKLDTHGFEVPIFEGAVETLKQTSLLIVEVYNFELTQGCLRFPQLCAYLEERGFRCLDLLEIMHRPKDNVLWQMDMVFAPADNPVFASNLYK
jgi:FkbM family methyltransferase